MIKVEVAKKNISYIKCTYEIKDNNDTQIINNTDGKNTNEEIGKKIKILNGDKKEKLIFKKKFSDIGINIIDFIIEEKLNNLSFMFKNCSSLKEISFNSFKTDKVTKMKAMFLQCNELEYLDLSNFDTSYVTDMGFMFNKCHKLKQIKGINNFKTIKCTNMISMFQECNELEYLDLSNFDTSDVIYMEGMFNQCHKIKEIKGINSFSLFFLRKI